MRGSDSPTRSKRRFATCVTNRQSCCCQPCGADYVNALAGARPSMCAGVGGAGPAFVYRALFWETGGLAFAISTFADNSKTRPS